MSSGGFVANVSLCNDSLSGNAARTNRSKTCYMRIGQLWCILSTVNEGQVGDRHAHVEAVSRRRVWGACVQAPTKRRFKCDILHGLRLYAKYARWQ